MTDIDQSNLISNSPKYRRGILLVLLAGVFWSTMGLGIRYMEVANVWQILFYRSCAMTPFLYLIISIRSIGRPLLVIHEAGLAGIIGGLGLVVAFAGGIFADGGPRISDL